MSDIEVAELQDLRGFIDRVASRLGGSTELPTDAEEVVAINWATTAPGIDWPERYWISRATRGEEWILWVEPDTMEAYGEDLALHAAEMPHESHLKRRRIWHPITFPEPAS